MTKNRPDFSEDDIIRNFEEGDYKRGQTVFQHNKVQTVTQKPVQNYDKHSQVFQYEAIVSGSHGEEYDTRVTIIESAREKKSVTLIGYCDCPVGDNCKHAVATCLKLLSLIQAENAQTAPQSETARPGQSDKASQNAQKVDDFQFQCLLDEIQFLGQRQDHTAEEWYHFHLFDGTDQPYSHHKRSMSGELKIMRHHYTLRGRLAKPKPMQVSTYFNKFNVFGYSENHRIAKLMPAAATESWYVSAIQFGGAAGYLLLKKLIQSGHAYFKSQPTPLQWLSTPHELELIHQTTPNGGHQLKLAFDTQQQFLVLCDPPVMINTLEHTAQEVISPVAAPALPSLIKLPDMNQNQYNQLIETLSEQQIQAPAGEIFSRLPEMVGIERILIDSPPVGLVTLLEPLPHPLFGLMFLYDGYAIYPTNAAETVESRLENRLITIHRDRSGEAAVAARLDDLLTEVRLSFNDPPPHPGGEMLFYALQSDDTHTEPGLANYLALLERMEALAEEGWQFDGFDQAWLSLVEADDIQVESEQTNDWFNLSFNIQVKGQTLPMAPLLEQMLQRYDQVSDMPDTLLLSLNEQEILKLPKDDVAPLFETLLQLYQHEPLGKGLRIQPFNAHLIAGLSNLPMTWLGDRKVMQLADKLKHFTRIETLPPPQGLQAELRPYQTFGLSWLDFLYQHGFNGVLADDMGLGKTLQTLSWLLHLKQQQQLTQPALLVVPTSLIGNWKSEAHKFTPDLNLLTIHGSDRHQAFDAIEEADLVLTSYPLLPRDVDQLKNTEFQVIILDEAQKIKNPRTKLYTALVSLKSQHRLCLTGTPIENHLGELWSLFNFLMPGFLGNQAQFKKRYQKPIEVENDRQIQDQLTQKTAPFLLRRTKHQVVQELPDKTEIIKTVEFGQAQARLYETIRVTMEDKVRQTVADKGLAKSQITLLDALLKLRQVCCDPGLVKIEAAKKVTQSAKLELLLELLEDLLESQHRMIIFSQFTSMLKIIGDALKKQKIDFSLLTGQTRNREAEINRFKQGDTQVFLISLKAGGVGLNLTEADTVIHYDPWWNPAVENQATDRAHRIGQDKEVFVYKLVVANTIEEKILQLQAKKQALQDKLYQQNKTDEQGSMTLEAEDLLNLLKEI
ncbi:MAG: SNF2-related protein [Hydrogenovibrio sp.]